MELSEVGWGKPGSQDRREPKADATSGADRPEPEDVRASPAARRGAPIQRHPPDLGGEGGNINFHAGDWTACQGVEETWSGLERLTNLAALQLAGMQVRRESLRRGALANEVQKLLHAC